jgi:hypothetical protein
LNNILKKKEKKYKYDKREIPNKYPFAFKK